MSAIRWRKSSATSAFREETGRVNDRSWPKADATYLFFERLLSTHTCRSQIA